MVRVMPLASQVPTNDARHYPIYQVCEELGIPVGDQRRASPARACAHACSTPSCSRTCSSTSPTSSVIVAHMGHPYEELLMNYMRKWPNLYVSCTAYAPRYMDPNLVTFMNTQDVPRPRALGQRRAVVPDAPLARRSARAPARRRRDGAVPRRHRAQVAHAADNRFRPMPPSRARPGNRGGRWPRARGPAPGRCGPGARRRRTR